MGKQLSGSVGKGGKNRQEDVVTVQYLLNCVPSSQGGPEKELVIDGLCGPLTEAAIIRFQSRNLGFADGRVDAGGQTLRALTNYDPYPNQNLNLPPAGPESKQGAKWGGTPSTNAWDPWGYNNPASKNYHVPGKEPGQKFGSGTEYKESAPTQKAGWVPEKGGAPGYKDGGASYKDGGASYKTGFGPSAGYKQSGPVQQASWGPHKGGAPAGGHGTKETAGEKYGQHGTKEGGIVSKF